MNSLTPGQLQKKYKYVRQIGEGKYGTVCLYESKSQYKNSVFQNIFQKGRELTSQYVAIKIYKSPNRNTQGIDFSCLRQTTCLQIFQHENILNCIQILYSNKTGNPNRSVNSTPFEIAAVMNFHIQLKLLIQKCGYQDKKRVAKHILQGLAQLHQNYFFHRDLKPDNILVSKQGYVKIADFGFTKEYGTPYKKYTYNACTPQYRAPQLFLNTHFYTEKSDIWSLGCVIMSLYTGKQLFLPESGSACDIDMLSQIFYYFGTPTEQNWAGFFKSPVKYAFKLENPKNLSQELGIDKQVSGLIQFIMKLDPTKRPSASEILNHDFFRKTSSEPFNVTDIFNKKLHSLIKK